jgi:hypothetical protein
MPFARKYIKVLTFVLVWMAAGWIFHLGVYAYLLLGVPLVVVFQLFIGRQPLRHLWVRDATSFRLGLIGILLAALLILIPDMICSLSSRIGCGLSPYGSCA